VRFFGKKVEPEAPSLSDVEVIRAKLAAVEQAITSAEAELRRISVESALSDDPAAGSDAITRISELRTRHDLLSNALRAALQAERDNAGRLCEREFQARRRSLAQKLGQLGRDAKEVTEALTALVRAYRKMIGTSRGIIALLPPVMQGSTVGYETPIMPRYLRDLVMVELWRVGNDWNGLALLEEQPKGLRQYRDDMSGEVMPLPQILANAAENIRKGFDQAGPAIPAARSAAPVIAGTAPEALDLVTTPASTVADTPATADYGIDLRGCDLGVKKSGEPDIWVKEEVAA
jgi:hypothetical protein